MNYKIFSLFAFVFLTSFSFAPTTHFPSHPSSFVSEKPISKAEQLYHAIDFSGATVAPNFDSFSQAIEGFYRLKAAGLITKDILTLIDFSKSSTTKRLWIIDLATNAILCNTYVAHGKNTGEEYATFFSNRPESNQSSLGFYATAETYIGKHGLSLRLDGLEKGFNDRARERAVVLHGAHYVSDKFIKTHNRLGRSQGCPAVPVEWNEKIINLIKDKTCLFIYHPSKTILAL